MQTSRQVYIPTVSLKPCRAPGTWHSIPGQPGGPAGALWLCLDSPRGCGWLFLTHRCSLSTIHGKKNDLRVALCLFAKSCPQPEPASPAWDSLLPLSSQKLFLPSCKVPATAEALWDRNSFSYFWLEVPDHNQSRGCPALPAVLPLHPVTPLCDMLRNSDIYRPDKPGTAWTKAGGWWISVAIQSSWAEHIFH